MVHDPEVEANTVGTAPWREGLASFADPASAPRSRDEAGVCFPDFSSVTSRKLE